MTIKHETLIKRDCGREIKIVSTLMQSLNFKVAIDTFVLFRNKGEQDWSLCKMRSNHHTKTMSREDYMAFGRPEFLTIISIGEFLKATNELRKKIIIGDDEAIIGFA